MAEKKMLLEVKDLKLYFPVTKGILRKKIADVKAVDGVSFDLLEGETLGLVGESGCGKTTIGRCILRQYKPTGGRIVFKGEDITDYSRGELNRIRRKMALIFQDPYSSLNPRKSAGAAVEEPLRIHKMYSNDAEYKKRVEQLFQMVGLNPDMMGRYPHEFSGGQRQRIVVARALACNPDLIVCDEPISALDVSIQAQIINLLKELQQKIEGLSYLFIAHDLSVVRHVSDRVAVMYLGRIVEITKARSLYQNPLHPYTRSLLSAVPIPDPFVEEKREEIILEGEVPSPLNPPAGCSFHPRCYMATLECKQGVPPLRDVGEDHKVACFHATDG
ncbi:MAG TPA: ATP-binding cassette domain-containing protein [Firmicutes bacterium]|nr:ATP-binding cassette domain-containing protein [Bacillota bacterium]